MKNLYLILLLLTCNLLTSCLPLIFTGAAVSVSEFAKDRPAAETFTDVRISSRIKGAFIQNNFRKLYAKIKVKVMQGRVLYTGKVEKKEEMVTAIDIAWKQEGVVEVINELIVDKNSNEFNLVQYTRDTMITSQIKSKTFLDRSIKFVNYTVITLNDVVYLFGIARSAEELKKVATIAANIHGVKKVISHVKIKPKKNIDIDSSSGDLLFDEK